MKSLRAAALLFALLTTALPGVASAADGEDEMPAPTWSFSHEDGETMLLFGLPAEWESSPNYLRCQDRSGRVEVELWADHQVKPGGVGGEATTTMTIQSGAVKKEFGAHAQDEEMNGGTEVTATLSAGEPVLAEFARTGVLKLTAFGQSSDMPPARRADAARFVQACQKPK